MGCHAVLYKLSRLEFLVSIAGASQLLEICVLGLGICCQDAAWSVPNNELGSASVILTVAKLPISA